MKKIWVLFLAMFSVWGVWAQTPEGLSFDDALSMMMDSNPALRAAAHEEEAARRERQAAVGLYFPVLSVGGSYAYMSQDIVFDLDMNSYKQEVQAGLGQLLPALSPQLQQALGGMLGPLMGQNWEYAYTLQQRQLGFVGGSVKMPIFMGGKINAAHRAAKISEKSVHEQTAQTRNALVSELVERYFGYALALQAVEVRRQAVDGVRKHLSDALAMEREGMITESERLYVEFKLAETERELQDAEMQLKTLRTALANTTGNASCGVPLSALFVLKEIETLDYFQDLAAACNPLLNQVAYKQQLAHENVRVRRAAFFPQVAAMAGGTICQWQVSELIPNWVVGVGVNLTLFDGLRREHEYAAAKQTERRVGALREQAGEGIVVLVESLYDTMLSCRDRIASIESSMSFAESYLAAKDRAFREGMCASTEMIDAELNLAKVRIERMQAAYQYDVALAKLLEAAGASDRFADYMHSADACSVSYNR